MKEQSKCPFCVDKPCNKSWCPYTRKKDENNNADNNFNSSGGVLHNNDTQSEKPNKRTRERKLYTKMDS